MTKPQKNCMCDKYTNCTDCQAHDTAIRNATLDELTEKLVDIMILDGTEFAKFKRHSISTAIESLRGEP
jgi:hypothetical protein